jgi:CPA1 family monovalent cation:H+ antiporter
LAALFGFLSHKVLRLPTTIGTTILSLAASAVLIAGEQFAPHLHIAAASLVAGIDFNQVVLHGMLALLLFAGALQMDIDHLYRERLSVLSLAVVATVLSTVVVAVLFKLVLGAVGVPVSITTAVLFGALISPTDPIAVLEMLRRVGAPPELESLLAGESLFNDGVGAVLFLALLDASTGGTFPTPQKFALLLLLKAGGAILLGGALGFVAYRLLRVVDSYRVEVSLTLALAMGGYALADSLHLSAPLEVVTAGLFVNGSARRFAMSLTTRQNVDTFWELLDDILNVVLFLLLGLELLVLPLQFRYLLAGVLTIPIALLARWVSVSATVYALGAWSRKVPGLIRVLTWGGLRGGLAVALALSLPSGYSLQRNLLLVTTYVVVVFSIVAQGLTLGPLLRRLKM